MVTSLLKECSWFAWIVVATDGMRRKLFFELQFAVLEPKGMGHQPIAGRL